MNSTNHGKGQDEPVNNQAEIKPAQQNVSFFVLACMATVTLMAILSELVPSGILPELMAGLSISEAQAGNLVGVYAIASAVAAIPLVSATVTWRRKPLLLILLIGFAASNFLVAIAPNYPIALVGRLIGGVCAGVMWPMIAAYGMKLVKPNRAGQATAIIMAGTTVGMSVGVPIMTWFGREFGWRNEFHLLGVITIVIMVLMIAFVPDAPGEARSKDNSIRTIISNRGVQLAVLLTLLAVVANYAIYVYITNLVSSIQFGGGDGNLLLAQVLFGVGCFISVIAAAKWSDSHLRYLIAAMLFVGGVSFAVFALFKGTPVLSHIAFVVWGFGFGALVSVFQAATTRQVKIGKAVATSVQSMTFNLSIMIASSVGGAILGVSTMTVLLIVCTVLLVLGAVIAFSAKDLLAPEVYD